MADVAPMQNFAAPIMPRPAPRPKRAPPPTVAAMGKKSSGPSPEALAAMLKMAAASTAAGRMMARK